MYTLLLSLDSRYFEYNLLLQKCSLLDVNYLLENMLEECAYHKQLERDLIRAVRLTLCIGFFVTFLITDNICAVFMSV